MRARVTKKFKKFTDQRLTVRFIKDGVHNRYYVRLSFQDGCHKRYEIFSRYWERVDEKKIIRGNVKCLSINEAEFKKRLANPPPKEAIIFKRAEYITLEQYNRFEQDRRKHRIETQQQALFKAMLEAKAEGRYP